ncbi:MAG: hypothetical protein JNM47_00145 [Hyphomonadaceae bacterium]|nr:hypothetical protein [Hyphomonadaceae bacterium]
MNIVVRVLAGLAGLVGVLIALATWANPAGPPAALGLQGVGALGEATIRADVAGFFGTFGLLALAGAWRGEARLFTAPLLLIGLALAGRILTVIVSGYAPEMGMPMAIEVGLLAIFGAGRFLLASR